MLYVVQSGMHTNPKNTGITVENLNEFLQRRREIAELLKCHPNALGVQKGAPEVTVTAFVVSDPVIKPVGDSDSLVVNCRLKVSKKVEGMIIVEWMTLQVYSENPFYQLASDLSRGSKITVTGRLFKETSQGHTRTFENRTLRANKITIGDAPEPTETATTSTVEAPKPTSTTLAPPSLEAKNDVELV